MAHKVQIPHLNIEKVANSKEEAQNLALRQMIIHDLEAGSIDTRESWGKYTITYYGEWGKVIVTNK